MDMRQGKAGQAGGKSGAAAKTPAKPRAARRPVQEEADADVHGVRISHPERVIFGEMGARKLDLARYYEAVAEALLPELRGRPISLIRCPRGSEKACFFQKHVEHAPAGTHKVSIAQAGEAEDELLVVESIEGVLGLVQFGAIEFHTWGAQEARMEQADRITLDLDPDPALNWKTVLEGARLVREVLVELALPNFIKTTGGKGLHIVIPLKPDRAWEDIRGFSKSLAEKVCGAMPQRFTMNLAKVNRRDKIFVDYLRNAREATTVCAFSARARAGAPVSVPLSWDELEPRTDVRGAYFNITNVPSHLTGRGADPWAGYDGARVSLGDFSIGERAAAH